jgi:septum formation protein
MLSILKNLDHFKIILASASPRRFELLKEIYEDHLTPVEYTINNARKKGEKIAIQYPRHIVICADTIVVLNNHILEKPENEQHAFEILSKLSGKTHNVITGYGLIKKDAEMSVFDHALTRVSFRKLNQSEIYAYIYSGEPFDKAGGYGAQGFGSLLIDHVEGCFFNVVGLPLSKLFQTLDKFLLTLQE